MIPVAVPAGSRFKGYQDYVVQELEIRPRVIRYRRERWLTPDGGTVVAPLPAGICGHFGANLRRAPSGKRPPGTTTTCSKSWPKARGLGQSRNDFHASPLAPTAAQPVASIPTTRRAPVLMVARRIAAVRRRTVTAFNPH